MNLLFGRSPYRQLPHLFQNSFIVLLVPLCPLIDSDILLLIKLHVFSAWNLSLINQTFMVNSFQLLRFPLIYFPCCNFQVIWFIDIEHFRESYIFIITTKVLEVQHIAKDEKRHLHDLWLYFYARSRLVVLTTRSNF